MVEQAGKSSGRTWLFSIARRRARELPRRRSVPLVELKQLEAVPFRDPDPGDIAPARENPEALTTVFGKLAPVHQEALILTFVHRLSYQG